jgi:hypothetical protein
MKSVKDHKATAKGTHIDWELEISGEYTIPMFRKFARSI